MSTSSATGLLEGQSHLPHIVREGCDVAVPGALESLIFLRHDVLKDRVQELKGSSTDCSPQKLVRRFSLSHAVRLHPKSQELGCSVFPLSQLSPCSGSATSVVVTLAAPSKLLGWPKAQISELVTLLDLHSATSFLLAVRLGQLGALLMPPRRLPQLSMAHENSSLSFLLCRNWQKGSLLRKRTADT